LRSEPRVRFGLTGTRYELSDLLRLRHVSRRLHLRARVNAVSWRSGMHLSRIRGRGMSFSESRPYQSGDDVRMIDWRVTARTGRAHTKVFEEEKERAVFVVAQFAPSMYFGTRVAFKHVVAAELAALVGWAALAGGDRVGALLASSLGHVERRPANGRRAVMSLLNALQSVSVATQPAPAPLRLADTLHRAVHVVRPGSLVFLISDFYDFDDASAAHLSRLAQHNDIAICQVLDTVELQPPPPGVYPVSDGRRLADLRVSRRSGERDYASLEQQFRAPLKSFAYRHRLMHGVVSAGQPVLEQIEAILYNGHSRHGVVDGD
jgi:uncharacterized protein (DUF58 family)